jgi:hypothetical protein
MQMRLQQPVSGLRTSLPAARPSRAVSRIVAQAGQDPNQPIQVRHAVRSHILKYLCALALSFSSGAYLLARVVLVAWTLPPLPLIPELATSFVQANTTGTLSSQSGNIIEMSRVEAARKYFRTASLAE